MFAQKSNYDIENGLNASHKLSKLITKCGKAHTIGEQLILRAVTGIMSTVFKIDTNKLRSVSFSNNTVSLRINEMSDDIEAQMCRKLQETEFSIQLDESTVFDNQALLLAYVRFIKNKKICEQMFFCHSLETFCQGENIFSNLKDYFNLKGIPIRNMISCATDGAPNMMGRYKKLVACTKEEVPNLFAIHCVIHRQHLCAKNLSERLTDSLSLVVRVINKIKTRALNPRLFKQLFDENDEKFERLLLHTEVRWLSKGSCLKRFFSLYDAIVKFLLSSHEDDLSKDIDYFRDDVAYLSDIFEKMNQLNLKLRGPNFNLIEATAAVLTFVKKLEVFKQNTGRREYSQLLNMQFTALAQHFSDIDPSSLLLTFRLAKKDFESRFKDLVELVIPEWL